MRKNVVMGVDLGLRHLISTSAYYGFGDETMLFAIREFNRAENWIAEQILRGSEWLYDWTTENRANVIVLEDLKISRLDVGENEKEVFGALVNRIKEDSSQHGIKVALVDPLYTSQLCSNCGRMGYRERMFFCPYCKYSECADVNAARNIGIRFILRQAVRDLNEGKDPWDKYFLAALCGPKPIDELWIRSVISKARERYAWKL